MPIGTYGRERVNIATDNIICLHDQILEEYYQSIKKKLIKRTIILIITRERTMEVIIFKLNITDFNPTLLWLPHQKYQCKQNVL